MLITHQQIIHAKAQLEELGRYSFGRKLRYAIHFNTPKIAAQLVITWAIRTSIFNEHGWFLEPGAKDYAPGKDADTPALQRALPAFLAEEEELDLRIITFEDTGETEFPPNAMPDWMLLMEEEKEEPAKETAATSNGQSVIPEGVRNLPQGVDIGFQPTDA